MYFIEIDILGRKCIGAEHITFIICCSCLAVSFSSGSILFFLFFCGSVPAAISTQGYIAFTLDLAKCILAKNICGKHAPGYAELTAGCVQFLNNYLTH